MPHIEPGPAARFVLRYFAVEREIIGGIHREALNLWRAEMRVHRHRGAEANRATVVEQTE